MDKDGDNNAMNLDYDDKRKTYSLNFKRRVVKTLLEKQAGNVSITAREFHVSRSNVIRWRGQTVILEKANANRLLNSIGRRRYRVGKSKYPLLDESVRKMVKERRAAKKCVTMKLVQSYARLVFLNLYPEAEIDIEARNFCASNGWLRHLMKRNNVVNRNATSVGQKVPEDAPDRCDTLLHEMKDLPPIIWTKHLIFEVYKP